MSSNILDRRTLFKGLGGLALSFPLLRVLAQAQEATVRGPLPRLVLICGESGSSSIWWRPRGGEENFDISFEGAVLKPLAPFRSKLLIINGVGNYAAAFHGVENHEVRAVTFTACANSKPGEPNFARGPSVDRAIIEKIKESRPLHACIAAPVQGFGSEYYFSRPGYPITGVGTLIGIFDALFAHSVPRNSGPTSARQDPLQAYVRELLDQQSADARALRSRLGPEARVKLDEYFMVLDERIKALRPLTAQPVSFPVRPQRNPNYNQSVSPDGPLNIYTDELDLIADGLILGVTQVACLRLAHGTLEDSFVHQKIKTYDRNGSENGSMTISDYHQDVAHAQLVGDKYKDLSPHLLCRKVHTAQAQMVARFLGRLDAARDMDGRSVLDNTLLVWTTQLGDQSSHLSGRLPYVLAGGLGEKMKTFRMGRFLDFAPGGIQDRSQLTARDTAVASHLLLNSVQRTFGIEQDVFGENLNPSRCRGYLPRAY